MINTQSADYSKAGCVDVSIIMCDGEQMTINEVVERLNLLDEKCIKYRTALEWVKKWGDLCMYSSVPDGWPTKDDGAPLSIFEIVNNALEG